MAESEDTPKEYRYRVKYTSFECKRRSNEPSGKDEVYAIMAHVSWREKFSVRVYKTHLYKKIQKGSFRGVDREFDNLDFDWTKWHEGGKLMNEKVFLVTCLEHDGRTSREVVRKKVEKELKRVVRDKIKTVDNLQSSEKNNEVKDKLQKNMHHTVNEWKAVKPDKITEAQAYIDEKLSELAGADPSLITIGLWALNKGIAISRNNQDDIVGKTKRLSFGNKLAQFDTDDDDDDDDEKSKSKSKNKVVKKTWSPRLTFKGSGEGEYIFKFHLAIEERDLVEA